MAILSLSLSFPFFFFFVLFCGIQLREREQEMNKPALTPVGCLATQTQTPTSAAFYVTHHMLHSTRQPSFQLSV